MREVYGLRTSLTSRCKLPLDLALSARHEWGATVNNAKFVIQVSKGLIRHQRARRLVMFYSVILALVMLFVGAVFEWPAPREHPLLFLAYWAVCAWITLLAVLLALYDVVKVRAEAQRLRRELAREHLEKVENDENPG